MRELNWYKQVTQLNKLPINRLAKEILEKANGEPDSQVLHILSLAEMGLDDLRGEMKPEELVRLREQVEYLQVLNPKKVLDSLIKDDSKLGGKWVEIYQLREYKDQPMKAAIYLARQIKEMIAFHEPEPPEL